MNDYAQAYFDKLVTNAVASDVDENMDVADDSIGGVASEAATIEDAADTGAGANANVAVGAGGNNTTAAVADANGAGAGCS